MQTHQLDVVVKLQAPRVHHNLLQPVHQRLQRHIHLHLERAVLQALVELEVEVVVEGDNLLGQARELGDVLVLDGFDFHFGAVL